MTGAVVPYTHSFAELLSVTACHVDKRAKVLTQYENLEEVKDSLWNPRKTNLCEGIALESVLIAFQLHEYDHRNAKRKIVLYLFVILQCCSQNSLVYVIRFLRQTAI
jgi:hypothetical protein